MYRLMQTCVYASYFVRSSVVRDMLSLTWPLTRDIAQLKKASWHANMGQNACPENPGWYLNSRWFKIDFDNMLMVLLEILLVKYLIELNNSTFTMLHTKWRFPHFLLKYWLKRKPLLQLCGSLSLWLKQLEFYLNYNSWLLSNNSMDDRSQPRKWKSAVYITCNARLTPPNCNYFLLLTSI